MQIEQIRRISVPPTPAEFQATIEPAERPVVIEGALSHWKAFDCWTPEHLKARVGDMRVTCMETPDDTPDGYFALGCWRRAPKLGRRFVEWSFNDYIDQIWKSNRPRLYLRSFSPDILQKLADDIPVPEYVRRHGQYGQMLWMGATNTIAPPHYDPGNTLHAVIRGRKRFLLFDRRELWHMHPYGVFSGYYPHTSKVLDADHADLTKYPRFQSVTAHECVLQPGDFLYIPVGWWHQVNTLEPSIAVSFWWRGGLNPLHPIVVRSAAFRLYQWLVYVFRGLSSRRRQASASSTGVQSESNA